MALMCRSCLYLVPFILALSHASLTQAGGIPFRTHVASSNADGTSAGDIGLINKFDVDYHVTITVGGRDFDVQLDTGSSDLWIRTPKAPLTIRNDSGLHPVNLTYGSGWASGPIQFAEVKIGEYVIPSQAFVNADKSNKQSGHDGILGISFDSTKISSIERAIKKAWGTDTVLGRTPFSNIIARDSSLKSFFDFQLGRISTPEYGPANGSLTIGVHEEPSVQSAPIHPVIADSEWVIAMENVITINGHNHTLNSSVKTATPGKLRALMDTGTSNALMPSGFVDRIYQSIPGSIQSPDGHWHAPCQGGANVTLYFGGQAFAIHPLDLTRVQNTTVTINGEKATVTICEAAFEDTKGYRDFDAVLGDSFLKNVYASFNFGSPDAQQKRSYIQMLSKTRTASGWIEFLRDRALAVSRSPHVVDPLVLRYIDSKKFGSVSGDEVKSGSSRSAVAGSLADDASSTPPSTAPDSLNILTKYGPVVIGLLAGNLLVMTVLCVIAGVALTRGALRNRTQMRRISATYAPVGVKIKVSEEDAEFNEHVHSYGG